MNKNATIAILIALMTMGVVSASDGVLEEEYVTMGYNDVYINTYCLYDNGQPVTNFPVSIDVVWQELDNVLGYSAGDLQNPTGFNVTVLGQVTGEDGCINLQLETTEENGLFGYTIGGWNGKAWVGPEDGYAFVPEFGVAAALIVLAAAGLYIYKKRD